ncbi:MAG TPA: hypothetical protein VFE24_08870 [Pirellulales bacterium]|nr:hypothetical protein [Pirellulales bacterium]
MNIMWEYLNLFSHWVFTLNRQDWILFMTGGCLVGFFFLRGLGSRAQH